MNNELFHSAKNNKLTGESISDARARKEISLTNENPQPISHPPLEIFTNVETTRNVQSQSQTQIQSNSTSNNQCLNSQQFLFNTNNMSAGEKNLDDGMLEHTFPTLFHEGFFANNPAYKFLSLEYLARYIT